MIPVMKLAEQVLVDRIISNKCPITRKSKAHLGVLALSCFFFITGTGFMIYAGFIWLNKVFEPEVAAAFTGLSLFALSIVFGAMVMALIRYKRVEAERSTKEAIHNLQGMLNAANDEFGEPIQENPKTALITATMLGLAIGNKIF